jgi:biopolymer transport protein ExbD
MDRNGIIHINQDEVQLTDLSSQLQGIFKTRRDHTLFVQGDSSLLFNDVAHIIDVAKGAGADRVGFMTSLRK